MELDAYALAAGLCISVEDDSDGTPCVEISCYWCTGSEAGLLFADRRSIINDDDWIEKAAEHLLNAHRTEIASTIKARKK